MSPGQTRFRHPVLLTLAFGTLALFLSGPRPATAADFDNLDCSIKEVPADASFYVALLRNREQVETVLKSKAWARFIALPGVQQGWQAAQMQMNMPGSPYDQFQQWAKDPENKQLVDLLLEMVSNEVFIYGGNSVAEVGDLYGRIMTAAQMEGLRQGFEESLSGKPREKSDEQATRIMLDEVSRNLNAIQVPEFVVGFKVASPDKAAAQLKRLEKVLKDLADKEPEVKGHFKWVKVDGNDFLTLTLDAKALKFDEQTIRKYETKSGQYDALIKRLKSIHVTISLGVRGKYVVLAVGETTAPVTKLGKGKRLIDQPELKPLAKFADRRLTAVSYMSKAFQSQTRMSWFNLEKYVEVGREVLPKAKQLTPELRARIDKDLVALAKDIKAATAKPGAALSFGFLTPRGTESYSYDWSDHPDLDGSKPLTILNHVGGAPLAVSASRTKYYPESWPAFVKWVKVLHGYYDEFAVPQMKPEDQKQYKEFMKLAKPLLVRLDEVTGKMFLPSVADGQTAWVLDARWSSKQWVATVPPSAKPVRLLEPALVVGVSDAALLRKSMGEYRTLVNDLMTVGQKLKPNEVPPFQVPLPDSRKIKGGDLYYYPLPAAWGLDPQVLPNAALSDKIAALAISQEHSERLLAATPFKAGSGPLADPKRALASASYTNWVGLTDLLADWTGLAEQFAPDGKQVEDALKQAREVVALLKVFRSSSSASYFEGGALVTHGEFVIEDVK